MRRGCGEARHCPRPYPALAPKPPIMQPVYAGRPRNLRLRRSEKTPFFARVAERGSRAFRRHRFREDRARGRFPAAWVWEPVDSTRCPDRSLACVYEPAVSEPVDLTRCPTCPPDTPCKDKFGGRSIRHGSPTSQGLSRHYGLFRNRSVRHGTATPRADKPASKHAEGAPPSICLIHGGDEAFPKPNLENTRRSVSLALATVPIRNRRP